MTESRTSRRAFLATLTAGAAGTILGRDFGPHAEPQRYPDPDIIALDEKFKKYIQGNSPLRRLYTGCLWCEGPAWNGSGNYFMWSDIPNDRQMRYLPDDGHVSVMRTHSNNSNGNTFDWTGRQLSCEHATRRVVRYEPNGRVTVLADNYGGKPFNAPNDIVVHPDGGIWFTDPGYGSMGDYEGHKGELQIKEAVYRIDPAGKLEKVSEDAEKPNGLCFSPDYKKFYLVDTGAAQNILVYDLADGKKLGKAKEFVKMKNGFTLAQNGEAWQLHASGADKHQELVSSGTGRTAPTLDTGGADGIRCDVDGNVWAGAGWAGDGFDGVHVFTPEGQRMGLIRLPETTSNLCFGGEKHNRLFITAGQSIYSIYVNTVGAHFC